MGSWRASIRLAGALALVCLLCTRCTPCSSGKALSALVLVPFGVRSPSFMLEGLRFVSCEKYTISVRAATVNSSEESGHNRFVGTRSVSTRWWTLQPLISCFQR